MTLVQVNVPDPQTKPEGLPRTAVIGEWRPERAITDRLFALAAQLDGHDPEFDDIAGLMATSLLLAGGEGDVVEKRRARAMGTPFRPVDQRIPVLAPYVSATCFACGWATYLGEGGNPTARGDEHRRDTGHDVLHLDLTEPVRAQSRGPQ